MKCAILSNTNVESLAARLSKHYEVFQPAGFGGWVQELVNPSSGIVTLHPHIIFVLLDAQELLQGRELPDLRSAQREMDQAISYLRNGLELMPESAVFVSTLDLAPFHLASVKERRNEYVVETYWRDRLGELSSEFHRFCIWDVKRLVEEFGRRYLYSAKRWYLGSIKYSLRGEQLLARDMQRIIRAQVGSRKKCLVLDLDNTLWGGIVGEDGVDGITLGDVGTGAIYKNFQQRIKEVQGTGTALAIASKNNETDVMEVFERHTHMVLRLSDFAARRINWNSKTQNIRELAEELNIGIDSMVFLDDNPFERDAVSQTLPEVLVPAFPKDPAELCAFFADVYHDHLLPISVTEEDRRRTVLYRENAKRTAALSDARSLDQFLTGLKTKIEVWELLTDDDIVRAAQLTHKTNQFNVTTKRYTTQDIRQFVMAEDYRVYLGAVKDRYGDNGKVFFANLKFTVDAGAVLDSFLMSCRVMGRRIEDQLFEFIAREAREAGRKKLTTFYFPTRKNAPVESLFDRLGCRLIQQDSDGKKTYEKDLSTSEREVQFHAALVKRGKMGL